MIGALPETRGRGFGRAMLLESVRDLVKRGAEAVELTHAGQHAGREAVRIDWVPPQARHRVVREGALGGHELSVGAADGGAVHVDEPVRDGAPRHVLDRLTGCGAQALAQQVVAQQCLQALRIGLRAMPGHQVAVLPSAIVAWSPPTRAAITGVPQAIASRAPGRTSRRTTARRRRQRRYSTGASKCAAPCQRRATAPGSRAHRRGRRHSPAPDRLRHRR